jgi:hypothetical protein
VLASKTVVLATNQLQFVSMADVVVVMRGGTAVEVGTYLKLMSAGGVFAALMKEAQVCGNPVCLKWQSCITVLRTPCVALRFWQYSVGAAGSSWGVGEALVTTAALEC